MLNLFKSNKLENLLSAFSEVLQDDPGSPMASEWIGVQSRGMKQWMSAELAVRFKICANVNFAFPKQIIQMILEAFSLKQNSSLFLNPARIFWAVLDQLMDNNFLSGASPLKSYLIQDDIGKKKVQLAQRAAKLLDDYMIYRPDMLFAWQDKSYKTMTGDSHSLWQADLWNHIVEEIPETNFPYQAHHFLNQQADLQPAPGRLPDRVSLFGISALPPVFMQIFNKISRLIEINIFVLAPSDMYFFDMKSPRERLQAEVKKSSIPAQVFPDDEENPFVSSLGKSGRDFFSHMEEYDYHEPLPDLFTNPLDSADNMLAVLQSDILHLTDRKDEGGVKPVSVLPQDLSISIHSCHSPMREAQVVKDLLLDSFEKNPGLAPHDVIVMMPDIESYAPFIESVFSLENSLPFSISDRRKRSESNLLEAFLAVISLNRSRFEKKEVLDLLSLEPVMEKFGFEPEDISKLEKIIDNANILWGRNGRHRKAIDLPAFEENTWDFGLKRLFLGMAMPENHHIPHNGIIGCHSFEGPELELLGKLAQFCDILFSTVTLFNSDQSIDHWSTVLRNIIHTLLNTDGHRSEDARFLYQAIDDLKKQADAAGFHQLISIDILSGYLTHQLDQSVSQGNFFSGKITFCNIMPMRSIPYRIVVLMGLDEASFPRKVFSSGLNLMEKYPRTGDKNERLEDRYLFLETLLSAREKIIISYTGQSIKDNSEIPCSGVVSELMDIMEDSFIFPPGYTYHTVHRLHPFDFDYFDPSCGLFSYSQDNCRIAKALLKNRSKSKPFISGQKITDFNKAVPEAGIDDLIRFFKNPVQWTLKEQMGIVFPREPEDSGTREPFSLSGLDQYELGTWMLETDHAIDDSSSGFSTQKAMGKLPYGKKGKLAYDQVSTKALPIIQEARKVMSQTFLPPLSLQLFLSDILLNVYLGQIQQDTMTRVSFGKMNGFRLLSGWINHLCLNVCSIEGYPNSTRLVGQEPSGKKEMMMVGFDPLKKDDAGYVLENLVSLFRDGMQTPVCFFCETGYQFARVLADDHFKITTGTVNNAMHKVRRFWYGDNFMPGEKTNRYVELCYSEKDPFENAQVLIDSGFVTHAVAVYQPMMKHMKVIR